jgi:hypothetical protein
MEVKNKDSSFQVPSSFDDINLGLLVHVLKRGIIPLILLIVFFSVCAHFYIKYTPKKYASSAIIITQSQKTESLLDIKPELVISNIEREIEFLKSIPFLTKIVDTTDLQTEYFEKSKLNIYNTELYKACPYSVNIEFKDNILYGTRFYVHPISKNRHELKYEINGNTLIDIVSINEKYSNKYFSIIISKRQ